jgi:hypothetical protein
MDTASAWGTEHEIGFLCRLHENVGALLAYETRLVQAKTAIRRYCENFSKRVHWGDVDPAAVRQWLTQRGYEVA